MNALVLYDSRYGNTERVAEAVALALQEALPTRLTAVDELDDCREALREVDLLVVGGPTHRHGVSEPLRTLLGCLEARELDGVRVAVFDTRLRGARIVTGSALDADTVKRAVAAAEVITSPASDTRGPAHYRTKMAGVMLARALARARERARA